MRKYLHLFLVCLLALPLWSQGKGADGGKGGSGNGGGAASSNNVLVQSAICSNGSGTGTYNCTLSATGTGNLILIQEADLGASAAAPSVPTDGGDTFVQDCTNAVASNGRLTYFSFPNSVSGRTTFAINPTASISQATIEEWSGMATASPLDVCVGALHSTSDVSWLSNSLAATQTDLAIGATYDRVNNTDNFTSGDVWTAIPPCLNPGNHCGNPTDGDGYFVQYIKNGLKSHFTSVGTINNSRFIQNGLALYKSAVVGSAPSGNLVTGLSDFENGANGNTLTAAIAAGGSHGVCSEPTNWSFGVGAGTGFTVATAAQQNNFTQNTTNGTTYAAAAGTRGISYDLSTSPVNQTLCAFPATVSQASLVAEVNISSNAQLYSILQINGSGGTDRLGAQVQTGSVTIVAECGGASGSGIAFTLGTNIAIFVQYVQNGTGTVKVYGGTNYGTLLGTSTCALTNTAATSAEFGQTHNAVGSGTLIIDNMAVDSVNGLALIP